MRVWDCHPTELAQQHLCGEWKELHQLWEAVFRRRTGQVRKPNGRPHGWVNHPETVRFQARPELLVARWFWLRDEGAARDFRLVKELDVTLEDGQRFYQDDWWVHAIPEEWGNDWYRFRMEVGWPSVDGVRWWTPWEREGISYDFYRLHSRYADGVLATPSIITEADVQFDDGE